jgi:porin
MSSHAFVSRIRFIPLKSWTLGRAFIAAVLLALAGGVRADINPWIASDIYDPKKWDTAGPQTASPWLHAPTWKPDQAWGVLSGRYGDVTAITGSWGGARDRLVEKGVSIVGGYMAQPMANPEGGVEEGKTSYIANLSLGSYFDLQRLLDWKRSYAVVSFARKHGEDGLTPDHVGNEFPVQLSSGDNATRLVHLALAKEVFSNKAELVGGRIITGEDFATLRSACSSLNQAICGNPIAANRSINWPTYPYGMWGARFKVKPGSSWYAQAGSYVVYPDFRDSGDHGVKFKPGSGRGVLAPVEYGHIVGKYRGEPGLPGRYKIGGYYDGSRLEDLKTGQSKRGTWGVYAMGEQMVYAEDEGYNQGLHAWLALSYAPPNVNRIQYMAAGGLIYQGLFPNRPFDALALIGSYGRYSSDLRSAQRARGESAQSNEVLLEVNYRAQLTPWLFIQPDAQVILRPSGDSDIDDAFVIGLALGFTL